MEIFLNTGPQSHAAGNFKVLFLPQFHWTPSKLYENIGYHGKSKCLLEYCNQKLSSSTQDNIFCLKHSYVLGLQFKQSVKAPGPLVK